MKKKVILTKGLSGSGKTHWAKQFLAENPNTIIVCKDDIRASMGAVVGDESKRVKESKVIGKRDELIMNGLKRGLNVIVADTNLNSIHQRNIKSLVFPKYRDFYDFEIKDFTDVPVDVCIERCADRPEGRKFWEKVIMEQKAKFLTARKLYTEHGYYDQMHLPKVVIFDVDGTLALMPEKDGKRVGRSPYEEERAHEDIPNTPVVEIAKMYCDRPDVTVVVLSGRKEDIGRTVTENWLSANGINYDHLYMRKAGDSRRDSIIKKELFDEHMRGKYIVHAVFDDRPQVIREFWVEEGFPVFSFGNPFHEF